MKELIIVGAGGFGRELLQWIKDVNKNQMKWLIRGFIDNNQSALDGMRCNYRVIGSIQDWKPKETEVFACAIANPRTKEQVVTLLKSRGATFESIIHPTAVIGECNKLGEGLIVFPNAVITTNVIVGNYVTLLSSGVGHDVEIGDYSTISSFCDVTGGVRLSKRVFLGSHATILPGKKIGDDAYVGAGSVVIKNVEANTKVLGNPAKNILF